MKIEINIENKHVFLLLVSIAILSGIGIVIAYDGNQPSLMGHSWDEIECDNCIGEENLNEADVAADILAELINIDGPGSGLDADTLDGLDSGRFASSTHTHTHGEGCYWTGVMHHALGSTYTEHCQDGYYVAGMEAKEPSTHDETLRLWCCPLADPSG